MAEAVAEVAAAVAVIAADVEKIAVWGLVIDKAPFFVPWRRLFAKSYCKTNGFGV